ncbi:MAG: hypothetical protein FK734_16170 [Asgard group archaeon]|nr:hypothetical protein [Asgard group archaeon]
MNKIHKITITLFSLVCLGLFVNGFYFSDFTNNKIIESIPTIKSIDQQLPIEALPMNGQNDANSGGDAGNSFPLATFITTGDYSGQLIADDLDYYTFSVNQGYIINVSMIPLNLTMNFDLTLYSPFYEELKQDHKAAGLRETIVFSVQDAGNFSILIAPATVSDIGNYTFYVYVSSQNDFGSNQDAGNRISNPLLVTQGSSNATFVLGSDTLDFYRVSMQKGQIIDVFIEPLNTTDIDVYFWGPSGQELFSSHNLIGYDEIIYYAISTTGFYHIQVQLVDSSTTDVIIPYNISIAISTQNDANANTDAGNTPEDAYLIIPLKDSKFRGNLVYYGDQYDFYYFEITERSIIYVILEVPATCDFDLIIYNEEKSEIFSSINGLNGANETILGEYLENGTYFIAVTYEDLGDTIEGQYLLRIGIFADAPSPTVNPWNVGDVIKIIISALFPILLLFFIILIIYTFTDVRIPLISNRLDKHLGKGSKADNVKSLKYAIRVRDDTINRLREDLVDKDTKRAKDLETLHRLEEDQKSKEKVLFKLREENDGMKNRLENLHAVNDDLANIIDSTIRRQLAKSSKTTQKINVSSINSLLWLSEERLINYITNIPLLNERYILDRSKNNIMTREFAREIVRQAYWKRVGAMHLKKIKQVKVTSLSEDTNIDLDDVKEILRELVERKEIPAPIHMDRMSLLLSISEELIAELSDVTQSVPIISLQEISKSYDTTVESAKVIFEKIAEEGYAKGEFINDDIFVILDLLADSIINLGSINIQKFAEENKLKDMDEDIKIIFEKLIQAGEIEGQFIDDNNFLCFNNLTPQLKELIKRNIEDINKGDTRRVVFDTGSVVESIVKERLMLDIHELENVSTLRSYQDIIESRELGRILRAAEETKVTLPSNVELKSLNRFWAQKIKHTRPGELPYNPEIDETKEFLFEANRALNKLLNQKIPTKWKKLIAQKLLKENDND